MINSYHAQHAFNYTTNSLRDRAGALLLVYNKKICFKSRIYKYTIATTSKMFKGAIISFLNEYLAS